MRINIYNEEHTDEVQIVWTEPSLGRRFMGIRIFQRSAKELHATPEDDDRTAVTFWVGSVEAGEKFATAVRKAVETERAVKLTESKRPGGGR
jgi:hypothetical protein